MMKTRIDKWLWAVRIYKTRSLATQACKSGRIKLHGKSLKPSYLISINDTIEVRINHIQKQFKVIGIIDKRVAASIAAKQYLDLTLEEDISKIEMYSKRNFEYRASGLGRPTKKDRRKIDHLKFKS